MFARLSVESLLLSGPLKRSDSFSCMLSHENLERHSKLHYLQDQAPNFTDELHITIADGMHAMMPGTSRSISPASDSSHELETPDVDEIPFSDSQLGAPNTDPERPHRVHFRSRVRISSGFGRHRRHHFQDDLISVSPDSASLSSSPSSSISVPLRSRSSDEVDKSGWRPLGQRASLLAHKPRRRTRERQQKNQYDAAQLLPNERTQLIRSPPLTVYTEGGLYNNEMTESARGQEVDHDPMFGAWPGRLVNLHVRPLIYNLSIRIYVNNNELKWWWWQLSPVVHCRCLDESDTE